MNIRVNAGFKSSRINSSSHTEGAVVTTMKPMNENSSITYNNVNNITYQGTQAQGGTAYISKDGVHTIVSNINAEGNSTKAGLIGTLAEEASHIVNGVAGRQIATGIEERVLESTGSAANAYFKEKYKDSKQGMTYVSDGKIDTSKLETNVGDIAIYLEPKAEVGEL
ncbi:hypothetical protein [Leptotrichia sp. oral taxon 847]|uniref:hypothetical protein n=1 Tax=Leptotrichia sp. oral taxon 847 TaxID=1785996 RepID=UPI000767FB9E|nr:hypothetical protein [Leptotrichia sp. oral taxon 847]AMD95491.1 hypothetical protein AXF11_07825 [Leptotrichia sp. oral taxon 847]